MGPVTAVDPATLPQGSKVHYLGARDYAVLPEALAAWDEAMLPFALNEATRFLSPTKTPGYLADGLPVVSTPARDVERTWGALGLVAVAGDAEGFVASIDGLLSSRYPKRLMQVDRTLARHSWDATWAHMRALMTRAAARAA